MRGKRSTLSPRFPRLFKMSPPRTFVTSFYVLALSRVEWSPRKSSTPFHRGWFLHVLLASIHGMTSSSKTISEFVASDDGCPLIFKRLPLTSHFTSCIHSSVTTSPPKCIVHSAGVCEGCTTKFVSISPNLQFTTVYCLHPRPLE